jgi:LysM repeat protein
METQPARGQGPDPGQTLFLRAAEHLRAGQVPEAREQLVRLVSIYKDSARFRDARRILGEMNMDRLFSRNPMPGKHDYTVKAGDSLLRIEKGSLTTIPFLNRINQLSGTMLQPGDRLVYQPLEFEVHVDLDENLLTLSQKVPGGETFEFFKDYTITSINLPPGAARPVKTKIQEKAAFIGEKKIPSTDPQYPSARKWLQTTSRAGRPGFLFRPQSERRQAAAPAAEPGAAVADAGRAAQAVSSATATATDAADAAYGLFLDDGDIEELNTIIRPGTPVVIEP